MGLVLFVRCGGVLGLGVRGMGGEGGVGEGVDWHLKLVLWNTMVMREDTISALCTRSWSHLFIFVLRLWFEHSYNLLWFLVSSLLVVFLLRGQKVRTCSASFYLRLSLGPTKIPRIDN